MQSGTKANRHGGDGLLILARRKPCLIDIGREEYTAKTFSSRRYEIWTMQSGWHTLPAINGVYQKEGENYKAKNSMFTANDKTITFSTDIAGAYQEPAKVKSWVRTYTLNRGKSFVIGDKFQLTEVVPDKVVKPVIEFKEVTDRSLRRYWPNGVTRVKLEFLKPGLKAGQSLTFTPAVP